MLVGRCGVVNDKGTWSVPSPFPRSTNAVEVPKFATTTSGKPSVSALMTATDTTLISLPNTWFMGGWNVPFPFPSNTETSELTWPGLAVMMSGQPSRFISARATELGGAEPGKLVSQRVPSNAPFPCPISTVTLCGNGSVSL